MLKQTCHSYSFVNVGLKILTKRNIQAVLDLHHFDLRRIFREPNIP